MLKLLLAALAVLLVSGGPRQAAHAHHSWKCPPIMKVTVGGISTGNRVELLVDATNTCGCDIRLKACPSDGRNDACIMKWMAPRENWQFPVMSGTDGKAKFDWGTHTNYDPCT